MGLLWCVVLCVGLRVVGLTSRIVVDSMPSPPFHFFICTQHGTISHRTECTHMKRCHCHHEFPQDDQSVAWLLTFLMARGVPSGSSVNVRFVTSATQP